MLASGLPKRVLVDYASMVTNEHPFQGIDIAYCWKYQDNAVTDVQVIDCYQKYLPNKTCINSKL